MYVFPKDFLWSASTAATQIEGGWNADGKGESIWDTLVHDGTGKIAHSENADVAIDFYHHWREDVALMKEIGLNAYRFSISWSRVLPQGTGSVNEAGLQFYRDLCDELLRNEIQPLVTLYHWDLPTALYRKGGWKNPESRNWFAAYTDVISRALGDRVRYWMTFNEPQMFCGLGLQAGVHAPFELNDDANLMIITRNILLAHGEAVRILRKNCPDAKVGIAPTGDCCLPEDDSPLAMEKALDRSLSPYPNYLMSNTWWADPIFLGRYPAWAKGELGTLLYPMNAEEVGTGEPAAGFLRLQLLSEYGGPDPRPLPLPGRRRAGQPPHGHRMEHRTRGAVLCQQVLVRAVRSAGAHHRERLCKQRLRHAGRQGA